MSVALIGGQARNQQAGRERWIHCSFVSSGDVATCGDGGLFLVLILACAGKLYCNLHRLRYSELAHL